MSFKYHFQTQNFLHHILFIFITLFIILITFFITNQIPVSVYAQRISSGSCDCIIDYTNPNNTTAIEIPDSISIISTEKMQSKTEGNLSWNETKTAKFLGIISNDFFLANFSGGVRTAPAYSNTFYVTANDTMRVVLTEGTMPSEAYAEIVEASVKEKIDTLAEVKLVGKEIIEFPVYNDVNFMVNLQKPAYYLLLISLIYNTQNNYDLVAVYETLLKVE